MKDSKRIDNKAKSRRIAAYALAGCMAVTAAPMTMPNMGAEIVEAADNLTKLDGTKPIVLSSECKVKDSTTFAEAASKIKILATQNSKVGTWSDKAISVQILDAKGNLVWNSDGDTSVPGTTKFGYGKTYTINATFERTIGLDDGVEEIPETTEDEANLDNIVEKNTVDYTNTVVFYPSTGMLSDEKVDEHGVYSDEGIYRLMKQTSGGIQKVADKAGVYKNSSGWWLVDDAGDATTAENEEGTPIASIEKNSNGLWYVDETGKVDFTKTGLFDAADATPSATPSDLSGQTITGIDTGKYYVVNGKVDTSKTGLVSKDGTWYNVVKGKVTGLKEATVTKAPDGKWYYINTEGESDDGFNGVAKNSYGTWYIKEGIVDFTKEGPVYVNADGADVGSEGDVDTAYFLLGGKVQSDTTGIVFYEDDVYHLTKGVIGETTLDERTLAKDVKTGKWYVLGENGKRENFWGLVKNSYGTWVTEDGVVNFEKTGLVVVDEDNAYPGEGDPAAAEYYVEGGKVQTGKNGAQISRDIGGREVVYNLKEGKISGLDIDKSVVKAPNGKWYLIGEDGYSTNEGIGGNSYGIWMPSQNGVIDFKATGFHKVTEEEGKLSGIEEGDVIYIKDGKFQKDVSGVLEFKKETFNEDEVDINTDDTIMLKNGVVVDEMSVSGPTVVKGVDGIWYYVDEDGKIDTSFDGVAKNSNGTWFIQDGTVSFKRTGFVENTDNDDDDNIYYVVNSKVATDKTGLVKGIYNGQDVIFYVEKGVVTGKKTNDNVVKSSDGVWYYVGEDGKTNPSLTGLAENKNGVWYIKNGRVDFTKTGIETISGTDKSDKIEAFDGTKVYIVGGKVQFDYTGLVVEDGTKTYFEKGQEAENDDPVLIKATDGKWYYVVAGEVDSTYTGLAKNSNGIWYVYKGEVSFGKTGIINQPTDLDDAKLDAGKYYVANGKMTSDKNGIVKSGNKEYYVKKSAVVTDTPADESVIKVDGTWYYINPAGEVDVPTDHIAENKNGVWYIDDKGRVDFKKAGLVNVTTNNVVSASGQKIYISGGKFQDEAECVVVETVEEETTRTYVKNGITVAAGESKLIKNAVVQGTDGKWYGVSSANGNNLLAADKLAKGEDGIYCTSENGVIDLKRTALVEGIDDESSYSLAGGDGEIDVVIINGKLATDISKGFVKVGTNRHYVVKGVCTPTTGDITIIKDTDDNQTLYYVGTDSYTVKTTPSIAIGKDDRGQLWYVSNGKVKYTSIASVEIGGTNYKITNGKAEVIEEEP